MYTNGDNLSIVGRKLKELREINHLSQKELADRIHCDPTVISKVEGGKRKDIRKYVDEYIKVLNYPEPKELADKIMRAEKVAVPDTSALLVNPSLIESLCEEYSVVVIPETVIRELQTIKDKRLGKKSRQAWEVMNSIGKNEKVVTLNDVNSPKNVKNDIKIINTARIASQKYNCLVDIISNDADFSALLKGDNTITPLHVHAYMSRRYNISNMLGLISLNRMYLDDYSNAVVPSDVNINEYLPDGHTLIISVVRDNKHSLEQRRAKVRWLIQNGANVNLRDCKERFFPPLTHAIQIKDGYEMFKFLLNECHANPNVASRNPYSVEKLRQQNEGNTPLMVASWHGKEDFVKALCNDPRTSINQQDTNGYTALIKASIRGKRQCCKILIDAGADTKILDIHDHVAGDYCQYVSKYVNRSNV